MAKAGQMPRQPRPVAGWVAAVAVAVAAVASGAVLLKPGLIGAVDVWPHLVRQQVVDETLRAGVSPFWTFLFYGGYPILRFYGPLFALAGGLAQFLPAAARSGR